MNEVLSKRKEGYGIFAKLISGFIFVIMAAGIGNFYSYIQLNNLSEQTTKVFNHPLRVTRAVLSADTNIVKIHRSMKDVALSSTKVDLNAANDAVNAYEIEVYKQLNIVEKWILGEKGALLLAETLKCFRDWKPIRDEVIAFTKAGNQSQAFAITKGKGAQHVELLNNKMEELKEYAASKALGMLNDSQESKEKIIKTTTAMFFILVLLSGLFGFYFSRTIRNSINLLINGVIEFGRGNLDHKVYIKTKDEIGWLANAFNDMAIQRKKVVEELKFQSEIITNMAEGVYLVGAEDGIIVYANPKFEEMFGYGSNEMIGKYVSIVNAPTDKNPGESAAEIMNELNETGTWSGEVANIKKDGTIFWCYANVSIFDHLSYGRVLISVHTDITKRKVLENSLLQHQNNLENLIRERTTNLEKEISKHKKTKEKIDSQNKLLAAINAMFRGAMACSSVLDVGKLCLSILEKETGSQFGSIAEVNKDGRFNTVALSNPGWDECKHIESNHDFMIQDMDVRGIWCSALKGEGIRLSNDPGNHPDSVGVPEGHPPLSSFIGVPYQHGAMNGVIGLANNEDGYTDADNEFIQSMAIAVVETIEKKRAEVKIEASLREKETLLQEIHHRVKNNMQVISSLLKLQANSTENSEIKQILQDSQRRVFAMSAVHDTLHGSEKLSEINLKTYLSKIAMAILQTNLFDHGEIKLINKIGESLISLNQAYPLGLIVNELLSNSLKHAFPGNRSGEITIRTKMVEKELNLIVMDNGIGIPAEFDWKNTKSLGLSLVRTLVEIQLEGSLDLDCEIGSKFTIKFEITE